MEECVDCYCGEHHPDDCSHDDAEYLESLHPNLVVPTHGLEHAPEAMAEVEPYCAEPCDVDDQYPDASEGLLEKHVRVLSLASAEFEELHLGPEVCEVEEQDTENDDSEYEHVLC